MTNTTATTAAKIEGIIIMRHKRRCNKDTGITSSACITVVFVDENNEEITSREFGPDESAKARAYAVKTAEKHGMRVCGLSDFDAGVWY